MAQFIQNADGGVHSVNDDFDLPKGWKKLTEEKARELHPDLFGAPETIEDAPADPPKDTK